MLTSNCNYRGFGRTLQQIVLTFSHQFMRSHDVLHTLDMTKCRTTKRFPTLSVVKKTFSKTPYFSQQTTALGHQTKDTLS